MFFRSGTEIFFPTLLDLEKITVLFSKNATSLQHPHLGTVHKTDMTIQHPVVYRTVEQPRPDLLKSVTVTRSNDNQRSEVIPC